MGGGDTSLFCSIIARTDGSAGKPNHGMVIRRVEHTWEAKTIVGNNFRKEWRQRLEIGTEEDSIHQLDRAAQVTIFRQRTRHCQLLSHLHRLKISHSDECPCSTGPQTPNHILQSCLTFDTLRRQTWSSPVNAHRKLWDRLIHCGRLRTPD